MIMPVVERKRYKLIIPNNVLDKGSRILKSCIRCRKHKTKCDALITNPRPCTHCSKKQINCTLDIITKTVNLNNQHNELIENLSEDVQDLKVVLNGLLDRKQEMIHLLIKRSQNLLEVNTYPTPPISKIESCINSPVESALILNIPSLDFQFSISISKDTPAFSITMEEAYELFTNYEVHFNHFLPIFPDDFFSTINILDFHRENELLFWCIITTSYLSYPDNNSSSNYRILSEHIKALVVESCWFKTPRSVYIISSLLILTTWMLPNKSKISDDLSIKYLSIMKNLALQFGLHKLEFVEEFSHKTKINIAPEVNLNNLIRERIYKFIHINSNYWMIYLGLSNNNHNGVNHDYILNKSSNIDILDKSISLNDHYINSLLKVSMIQLKLNENFNDLIAKSNDVFVLEQINTTKFMNVHMYDVILSDLNKLLVNNQDSQINNLINIAIESSRLQLYLYSLSQLTISIEEYKSFVKKIVTTCFRFFELFQLQFSEISTFNQLPVHFKFPINLVALILVRIYKSPLLNTVQDYELIKEKFNEFYNAIVLKGYNEEWEFMNSKLFKTIDKFNGLSNLFILEKLDNSYMLVSKMNHYLISSLNYEMIWLIYEDEHYEEREEERERNMIAKKDVDFSWETYGFTDNDKEVIEYIIESRSIFN